MKVEKVRENKKQFLDLLLIGDEQEDMIDRYLDRGDLFALYDGDLKSACVVTCEGDGICEVNYPRLKSGACYRGGWHALCRLAIQPLPDVGEQTAIGRLTAALAAMPLHCGAACASRM